MGGGGGEKVPGKYIGWWGALGSQPQKGVTSYALSANRQRPFAGAAHAAVFNTWRRFSGQVLFVVPPFIALYYVVSWANHRNEFLNSKEGRRLYATEEE